MADKKILIVDDDPDITYTMQLILEGHGYQVDSAVNSATARSKLEQEKPETVETSADIFENHKKESVQNPPRDKKKTKTLHPW